MASTTSTRRHVPLAQDIETSGGRLRTKSITGKRKSRSDEPNSGETYIDARSSKKILSLAQDLADEDAADRSAKRSQTSKNTFEFDSRFADNDEEVHNDEYVADEGNEDDWQPGDEEEEVLEEDLDPEELAVYKKFLPEGYEIEGFGASLAGLSTTGDKTVGGVEEEEEGQGTNLAELILQRIAEKEARDEAKAAGIEPVRGGGAPEDAVELPARAVETFEKVGQIMSRYKSGPLPKPFKVLPTLPQWPDLLAITQPDKWTAHATYAATKIFISAKSETGQYFIETILLERFREELQENKKLNVHLYNALHKCFYRPAAFFKGFLFPLVQSGCTLKEANVVASVLAKTKIPVLHSAAALLRVCEISAEQTSRINSEAAGSANIFIRILLDKKYALPYKVVDALVFHFLRFRGSANEEALGAKESKLPVLWHQSFLSFAQTYKHEITEDQREALLDLLLVRGHKDIGPEIRRELVAGRARGVAEVMDVDKANDDGDDTMQM